MTNEPMFYLSIAERVSLASRCKRNRVGAVIVFDGNIIAFGYNGTPRGFDNCCENSEGDTKIEVLHAESNAIAKCAKSTQSSQGAVLYVTVAPCFDCAKLIIQAGISKVYYSIPYRNELGLKLLHQALIPVKHER